MRGGGQGHQAKVCGMRRGKCGVMEKYESFLQGARGGSFEGRGREVLTNQKIKQTKKENL